MEWVIAAGVAVISMLAMGAAYFIFVGPADVESGKQQAAALQKSKADGLAVAATTVEKMAERQAVAIDARAAAEKQRDDVDVANDLITKKLGSGRKS